MRILLVENGSKLSIDAAATLKSRGIIFDQVRDGADALDFARSYEYDALLLSHQSAGLDGLDLLRRMRAAGNATPVVMLAEDADPKVRVKAFGLGADDVVGAGFDADEFGARVNAVVRRSRGFSQPVLVAGSVRLNLDSREVCVDEQRLHLTVKEYSILELMFLRKGAVLRKEVFLNHLYGGMDEPEIKIIDVLICKLRKKLASVNADNLIRTVWGQGYMLREPGSAAPLPVPAQPAAREPKRTVFAA